jgi:hypothetical protein
MLCERREATSFLPVIDIFKYRPNTSFEIRIFTKEFISKTTPPHPCPLPPGERGLIIFPPLRGGDEGEGDACGFTNDRISNS